MLSQPETQNIQAHGMINSAGEGSKYNLNRKSILPIPITVKQPKVKKIMSAMTIEMQKSSVSICPLPITKLRVS